MEQVIYLDVLFIINLFINYFLFLATSLLLHQKAKRWRILLSASIGGFSSFLILFDNLSFFLTLPIKLLLAALLVLIAYGYHAKGLYIKTVFLFFLVNFVFAGAMIGIWLLFAPAGMVINNGIVYFNISVLHLILGTLAAYFAIQLFCWLLDHRIKKKEMRRCIIEADGRQVIVNGFIDTGNKLIDSTTGTPVVICEYQVIAPLIPSEIQESFRSDAAKGLIRLEQHSWAKRIRMIPFSTIGGKGVLLAFKPDCFYFLSENGEYNIKQNVLIGVTQKVLSHGEYHAILSSMLFS